MKSLVEHINLNTYGVIIDDDMINERYINAIEKEDKEKYADEIWELLQGAYSYCGGIKKPASKEELIKTTFMWKMVRKGGKIVCVSCYKTGKGGRKICLLGADGSEEGKVAFKKMLEEDFKLKDRHSWLLCSGKAAISALKRGGIPVPADVACKIQNKGKDGPSTPHDDYWINYDLNGEKHLKLMVGNIPGQENVEAPQELIDKLIKQAAEQGA